MTIKKLCEIKVNQTAKVLEVDGDVYIKRRLLELGFTKNTEVKMLSISPLKNSFLIAIRGYSLALRKNSLELVSVYVEEW